MPFPDRYPIPGDRTHAPHRDAPRPSPPVVTSPRTVLVVEQHAAGPPGPLAAAIERAGLAVRLLRVHAGEPLPGPHGWAAVVLLGGTMDADEDDRYPVIAEEKALVRACHADGVPVLGICLGAQVAAAALGGTVIHGRVPEIGFPAITLTEAGRTDPVLRHLDTPVLDWHGDTFSLPDGAVLLARSDRYFQAFRVGSTLGLQFHPEASAERLPEWIAATPPRAFTLARMGRSEVVAEARHRAPLVERAAAAMFDAWVAEVIAAGHGALDDPSEVHPGDVPAASPLETGASV